MPQFDTIITTNDQSLDRVLGNPLPVLLILANSGMLPMTAQSVLGDLAKAEAGKLLIAKIDTSENTAAARRFGADGLRLIAWKDGAEQVRLDDPTPAQMRASADYALARGPKPEAEPHVPSQPSTTQQSAAQSSDKGATRHMHPIKVDEASFNDAVLHSDQPVLVDFWAPWCGPCRMIAPSLEKLAGEFAGQVHIAKLNVDENPQLAAKYGAQSIPLLVMFKNGKPVQRIVGAHPEPSLRQFIQRTLT